VVGQLCWGAAIAVGCMVSRSGLGCMGVPVHIGGVGDGAAMLQPLCLLRATPHETAQLHTYSLHAGRPSGTGGSAEVCISGLPAPSMLHSSQQRESWAGGWAAV
jgi:hypothetical protein